PPPHDPRLLIPFCQFPEALLVPELRLGTHVFEAPYRDPHLEARGSEIHAVRPTAIAGHCLLHGTTRLRPRLNDQKGPNLLRGVARTSTSQREKAFALAGISGALASTQRFIILPSRVG